MRSFERTFSPPTRLRLSSRPLKLVANSGGGGRGHTGPSAAAADGPAPLSVQVGAGDLDGFQADTEEEEEEDGDCVILNISDVGGENLAGKEECTLSSSHAPPGCKQWG